MEYIDLLNKRFSCRGFTQKKIDRKIIDEILSVVKLAPTGRNRQPQLVITVDDELVLNKLYEATPSHFNAKLIFVICYDEESSAVNQINDNRTTGKEDAAITMTYLMLQIYNLGLGNTWVALHDEAKIKDILNIPLKYKVLALLPCGYINTSPSERHFISKEDKDLIKYNKYEE